MSLLNFFGLLLIDFSGHLTPGLQSEESPFPGEEGGLECPHPLQDSSSLLVTPDDKVDGVLRSFFASYQMTPESHHSVDRSNSDCGLCLEVYYHVEISTLFHRNAPCW